MPIWATKCGKCGIITPHSEEPVLDLESATVWYCLYCGKEKRPQEPGSPNEPVEPVRPKPILPKGRELVPA